MNKAQVIEQLKNVYQPILVMLKPLSAAQLDAQPAPSEWSIKDLLGHFIFWDDNFTNMLKALLKLEARVVLSGTLDEINAKAFAAQHEESPAHVLALFEKTEEGLVAAVGLFTDEQLTTPAQFAISGERPLGDYIVHEVRGHFGDHMEQLRRLVAQANPTR